MGIGLEMKLLYASTAVGTAKNTFATETNLNDAAGMGVPYHLPRDFWLPNNAQVGRGLHIRGKILASSTGTPTFTPVIRLGPSAAAITGPIIATSAAALTTGSGISGQMVDFEVDVIMKTLGAPGANSTLQGVGRWLSSGFANIVNPLYGASAVASGASPGNVATVDTTIENWLCVNALCGTSNAANQLQLIQLLVFGLGVN